MTDALYTALPDRASIIVSGPDRGKYLQNLITQDIYLLESQPLIYSCLLTPQGKFLFDFFIRQDGDAFILDCEADDRASALFKRLSMYTLRSDVTLELADEMNVWQIWNASCDSAFPDPRHKECGYRCYSKPENAELVDFTIWDEHRIRHEIPDGSRDLIPEKSFIHEGRLDDLNAISYTKGCYIGQELVSRMHHRGLVKKVLKCVKLDNIPERAELRSTCGNIGLALVRL
jgi:folate-binding protein YgfZ